EGSSLEGKPHQVPACIIAGEGAIDVRSDLHVLHFSILVRRNGIARTGTNEAAVVGGAKPFLLFGVHKKRIRQRSHFLLPIELVEHKEHLHCRKNPGWILGLAIRFWVLLAANRCAGQSQHRSERYHWYQLFHFKTPFTVSPSCLPSEVESGPKSGSGESSTRETSMTSIGEPRVGGFDESPAASRSEPSCNACR